MEGIDLKELYERISHLHEVEFIYGKKTYIIQPEEDGGKSLLTIWQCTDTPKCLHKQEIPYEGDIPNEIIDLILSERCFDGKSFKDIENSIVVTVVY